MKKLIVLLVLLALSGALIWRITLATSKEGGQRPSGKPPVAVQCEPSFMGDIEDIAEFTGTLAGRSEVSISPKISGRVLAVHADLGDSVEAGQLLAELDDIEARHGVEEARAKLTVARASLEECETNLATAQRELERVRTLRERKVAAESELEAAESEVNALLSRKKLCEATIEQHEAALRAAEARLDYTQIAAPISGYVGKRHVDEGAMVSPTTPILMVADIGAVKTVIHVVERDYAKIRVGLPASLTVDAYPGETFEGRVARIAPILDPDTRAAETEIEIGNPDGRLKPGMFTRVRIRFGVHENVVLIPARGLVKRDMTQGVFVPGEDGTARFVELQTGLANETSIEAEGVEAGLDIIVVGQHLLNDGDPIAPNRGPK